MSLIRYSPRREFGLWRPFADLQSEINRLFSDTIRDVPTATGFVPAIDVAEKDDRIVVKADLPGLSKDDIQVSVHDGVLSLRGKREHQEEVKEDGYTYFERSSGAFSRSIQLPVEVEPDKISAHFKDGVLTIEAPKSARALPRSIDIKVK